METFLKHTENRKCLKTKYKEVYTTEKKSYFKKPLFILIKESSIFKSLYQL